MLSLIIGSLLFVCSSYIGYAVMQHYKKRYNFLSSLCDYYFALQQGISYLKLPLEQITRNFCNGKKGDLYAMLENYCLLLNSGYYDKNNCKDLASSKLLTAFEQNTLGEVFYSLGKSDYDTQLSDIKSYLNIWKPILDVAKQNYSKYGILAFKLGILAGLALLLICV